ncbi:MAG: succinate dehydrogenase [Gracilibacteraceae bacterium]|nr:succinate dehydrogenase [Gracilibacteraceae bacterium]
MDKKSNFLIRRIHSLLAIIPIGIFLLFHLSLNSTVFFGGRPLYEAVIHFMKNMPLVWVLELVIIFVPILVHAIYGIWIVYVAKNNAFNYKYGNNWAFYLQRITALITAVFLVFHVYLQRFSVHEAEGVIDGLTGLLQNPLFFILYAIGLLSAIFHFCNGFFTFLISWGITIGDHSQKICRYISMTLFVVIGVWGVSILTVIAGF